jgi:hypothetical protein
MDQIDARKQLNQAHQAREKAERTPVPAWTPPIVGLAVFAGFAALALLPLGVGWRLTAVAVALTGWAIAGWLVLRTRAHEGIRGIHGRLRTTTITLAICTIPIIIAGLNADNVMRTILLGLGAVAGLAMGYLTAHQDYNRG